MRYSLLSVSLVLRPTPPTPGSHTPRALSFTSLHFSRFASQAGSRSADQRGKGGGHCLSRIINYWPQAHAVPDRPGGEALCTEIPTLGKKKQVEDELFFFFFYIVHLRMHGSASMDFSDYSYCRCWISNFCMNSWYFPRRRTFPTGGCVRHSPVCLCASSELTCEELVRDNVPRLHEG